MMFKNKLLPKLILILLFFILTPVTIAATLFSLHSLGIPEKDNLLAQEDIYDNYGVNVYASLPDIRPSVSSEIEIADSRVEIIRQYLKRYNSPLEPYAEEIVEAADQYGLDYRLITAIAQQESNLCKRIPPNTYNCWGWGIHSQGTLGFESFSEGIWTVTKGVKQNYVDEGFETVEDIMSRYTPLSNGSWANGVREFMSQMR